ncbi:hypothetical protein H2Y56_22170 [Pectobacterium aroidearum]|uniref:Uncharacterized protein n=1 Tax=Pectobacterium aroidearum TaxID=1201031 RepID=A0ABR5ZJP6_9GAMM|nr:hypothetical protein [Pectobacterium aroidearum]MBA5234791.1 hypothetical protein [Pectobacterium aroidearum]MBA5739907.1 hypothetical protein [Pectobacterium aroidearum]
MKNYLEILLVGGPYDGDFISVPIGATGEPMPQLRMPQKPSFDDVLRPYSYPPREVCDLIYTLKEVMVSSSLWNYQYHYESI